MLINGNDDRAIFIQIAEGIEDGILTGVFAEESQIPSITEFAVTYKINPATALKGINLLVESQIIYKKRGVGMFVSDGAVKKLRDKRQEQFYKHYIQNLVEEAKRLDLTQERVIGMIERGFQR
ncbi:MAG: GntR family transcriptional regulator [Lachnospiraceae bacterium]